MTHWTGTPEHLAGSDDDDDLATMDICGGYLAEFTADDGSGEPAADLDFLVADGGDEIGSAVEAGEDTGLDALLAYAPAELESGRTELEATASLIAKYEDDEQPELQLFTVTNPAGTVSVSALMDGRIHQFELSAEVTSMTESELEEEILVIANLARQKAQSAQYTLILDTMSQAGAGDQAAVREFASHHLNLPTPEQAAASEAEVFATRYGLGNV